MGQFQQLSAGAVADLPLLPQHIRESAEELHEGKLWAWCPARENGTWVLAVAAANLPGLRPVRNIPFPTEEDALFAASIHNHQRGLTETEVERIVASSRRAEAEFVQTLSSATSKERH